MMNKLNRIGLFLFGVLLFACAGNLHAQQAMTLDGVITQAAKDIEKQIAARSKLAVLNFTSSAEVFSDYVIEELTGALVMNRTVTVIERKSLDLIRKEMNLQLSGDVSDDSAQAIGKQLGAQVIVTGSLTNLGDVYRFRVKVINVETARIEAQFSYNLGNNQQVAFLLSGSQSAPLVPSVSPAVPGSSGAVAQTNKVYKIGDTGPAGGIIFYDKGNNSDGWRYMEVSPQDLSTAKWGGFNRSAVNYTEEGVGSGKENTRRILVAFNGWGEAGTAAQLAAAYSLGGYTDWFLPSKGELNLVYHNLRKPALTSFSDGNYWSSSETPDGGNAWNQDFTDGEHPWNYYFLRKDHNYRVRAIRQF